MLIAKNLLFLRKKKGIQQAQIPDVIGFPQGSWSRWENAVNAPNISAIITIADFFGVSIDELVRKDLSAGAYLIDNSNLNKNAHLNAHPTAHLNSENEEDLSLAAEEQQPLTMPYPELCKLVFKMQRELNKIKASGKK